MAAGDRRTFADYQRDVLHALGNPDADELTIRAGEIVNDALEHIAAMHGWNWLSTGETTLSLVGGRDYVELPADFGRLTALTVSEGWDGRMIETTWEKLAEWRGSPIRAWSRSFWYVVQTGNVAASAPQDGLAAPTIELYPAPSSSESDALILVYRRFLRPLQADGDRPQWPSYMDRPLSLLARAFAATDYDDSGGEPYLGQFQRMARDLIARDGMSRRSFGQGRGGLYPAAPAVSPFYPSSGIPDPG